MHVVVHQIDGVATLRALPLAAGLLVASARRDSELAKAVTFTLGHERLDPDESVERMGQPDVLAFSSYVWNERHSLELARRARARFPGAFVLFGGPSVPRRPARAAAHLREHDFIDALAFGEGERSFVELCRALLAGGDLATVPGLALARRGSPDGALLTGERPRIADFEATGSPYLDGTFAALVTAGAQPDAAIVETNRGCPFACTFCDWGQAIQSRVRELPRERLEGELDWIAAQGIPYLYIVDANYGIRKRDLAIVRGIGERRARTGSPAYVFFHLTKNAEERHLELVHALVSAGVGTHLALSAQDFEPRVLRAVKRDNIRLDRALGLRRACHEAGIPTLNELILGLPEQSYDSFSRSMVRAVTPYPLDAFNLYLARLLENAEMSEPDQRERYGIVSRWLAMASFHHEALEHVQELEEVVVATAALPPGDWKRAHAFGYFLAAAHNLGLLDVVLRVVWHTDELDPRDFVERLLSHLTQRSSPITSTLQRYANAVADGVAMVLPHAATGRHLWPVEDAVALEVVLDRETFFADVADFVAVEHPEHTLLADAVTFQRFVTPALGDGAERELVLGHDVAAWRPGHGAPARGRVRYGWSPSPTLVSAQGAQAFLTQYLALRHARVPTGCLERVGS
ncbi:MAG: radical SAM protein [Myxococcales bacterium]|nr:radical SAM protein [Myxococcales bacterium]